MQILFLCKRYYTNKDLINDRFGRLYHFPKEWKAAGHDVTVIAFNYHTKDACVETMDGVEFYSLPVSSPIKLVRTIKRIVAAKRFDMVFASADQLVGMVGLFLARLMKMPFVFDIYDDYGAFGISRFPGMKWLFRQMVKRADYVCCVSVALRQQLLADNERVGIYPNGTDTALFRPMDKAEARQQLGFDQDGIYIGFAGSMDARFDNSNLMQALELVRKELGGVVLVLAGVNQLNFDLKRVGVIYLGSLAQAQIPTLIAASDVMVLPYSTHPLAQSCNPCKLAEYLACGRPVVAAEVSDIRDWLPDTQQSLYRCGSAEDLAQKLLMQIKCPETVPMSKDLLWSRIAESLLAGYLEATGAVSSAGED